MTGIDWILALPLLYAAYRGFREGIAAQLGGMIGLIAGIEGIFCGASAIYTAVAGIVDGEFNRPIMPV